MKTIIILFCVLSIKGYSQDKIAVSTNSQNTFIETYEKKYEVKLTRNGSEVNYNNYNFKLIDAYRLGPSSLKKLKEGINTALNWTDLNVNHKKSFEKEICRIKVMEKEDYKFHGYIEQLQKEMVLVFKGFSDGTFLIELKFYDSNYNFIKIQTKDMLINFKNLLNGKSSNSDVDDIFKR